MNIVYFAPVDWEFLYQRPQQLAVRLGQKHYFHYVQPFGLRNVAFSDFGRVGSRLRSLSVQRAAAKGSPHVRNLFFVPWAHKPLLKLNGLVISRQLRTITDESTIIWVTLPSPVLLHVLPHIRYRRLVYEMMDDYPRLHPGREKAVRDVEERFLGSADLVIVTSSALAEKARRHVPGDRVITVGNGVDYAFFNESHGGPPRIVNGEGPIAGYAGTIDRWVDVDLIDYLAGAFPGVQFVLVGPRRIKTPPVRANIHYLGAKPYAEMPGLYRTFDVCLIPFSRTPLVDAVNPVKLWEYLSLGKPVVSTAFRELEQFKDLVYLADDTKSFASNLEVALTEVSPELKSVRREAARANDWSLKAFAIEKRLLEL